jgi:non-ribosomal peptide synthetase component F
MRKTNELDLVHVHSARERLLSLLLAADRKQRQTNRTITAKAKRDRPVPLSYAQERIWFLDQVGLVGAAYNISLGLRLSGELVVEALERSFAELMCRHESLRTRIGVHGGVPHQLIEPPRPFELHRADFRHVADSEEREQQLREYMRSWQLRQFDLSEGPLFRVALVRLGVSQHALLFATHHVAFDGWSTGVLLYELSTLYAAYVQGQSSPLPQLTVQYADYAIWQRTFLQEEVLQEQLRYWKDRLLGAPPQLELPADRPRPAVESFKGAELKFQLPAKLSEGLKELGRREGVTPFVVYLAVYQILLSRWAGQQDVVVGSPIAGRGSAEVEGLIGVFVNTLVLRTHVSGDVTFRQLLEQVKEVTLAAYAHQDLPFEVLVKELRPERSLTRQPIFQVMLALQNYPDVRLEVPGLTWNWIDAEVLTTHVDLTLYLAQDSTTLSGVFVYATDLFDFRTIERIARHFQTLLEGVVADPDCSIGRLPLLSEAEKQQLLVEWNDTKTSYSKERCVQDLFEEQVNRTPDAVAIVCQQQSLTYTELNARANQLAWHLSDKGVGPDQLVGICVERGLEMVVGLLGILKAGGAYVPLDPNYPFERLAYMLKDAAPRVLLTQERLKERLPDTMAEVIALDKDWNEISLRTTSNLDSRASGLRSDGLAYVIYTSGSTGQPKGVAIEHRNAVNLICWAQSAMARGVFEKTLHSTSLNFDLSVYECFVPLACGGSIWVVSNALALVNEPIGVTLINTVPSAIKGILDSGSIPETTRVVNLAGEVLKAELVDRIFSCSAVESVCNLYGPSETTTYSSWISMPRADGFISSIGRPIGKRVALAA